MQETDFGKRGRQGAMEKFFMVENLAALREQAQRRTAAEVDRIWNRPTTFSFQRRVRWRPWQDSNLRPAA
jgi:K+-sensing histidine kinase KdpD